MSRSVEASPELSAEKKRKRSAPIASEEELEIDINLPEPPSKKAKRKEKKAKSKPAKAVDAAAEDGESKKATSETAEKDTNTASKRSEHGIWIGNLPFSTTPDKLREFFTGKGDIASEDIVRVNLPTTPASKNAGAANSARALGPVNKGFAYVDFKTEDAQRKAIALSETLIGGRATLIKDAKSFVGRPQKAAETGAVAGSGADNGKEPSKKVFVGNLAFDVSKDDLTNLLARAGPIEDCFLATFEDSGKCKGFGWVRFATVEAAQAAVRGFIYEEQDDDDQEDSGEESEDGSTEVKQKKQKGKLRKKIFLNKLFGRMLRCEFAEDDQTRYKKRFGKDKVFKNGANTGQEHAREDTRDKDGGIERAQRRPQSDALRNDREERRKRRDARSVAPGKALANTQRASAAIVAGAGKKISFDE